MSERIFMADENGLPHEVVQGEVTQVVDEVFNEAVEQDDEALWDARFRDEYEREKDEDYWSEGDEPLADWERELLEDDEPEPEPEPTPAADSIAQEAAAYADAGIQALNEGIGRLAIAKQQYSAAAELALAEAEKMDASAEVLQQVAAQRREISAAYEKNAEAVQKYLDDLARVGGED